MQKNAIVRSIDSDQKTKKIVIVEPVAFTECAGCSQICSKKQQTIPAINKKNFQLKPGSLVIISTTKMQEAIESIVSLVFPIAMAIAGYFLSDPIFAFISRLIKKDGIQNTVSPEGIKALIVIIFFGLASFLVLKITRSKIAFNYPEITNVLEQEH